MEELEKPVPVDLERDSWINGPGLHSEISNCHSAGERSRRLNIDVRSSCLDDRVIDGHSNRQGIVEIPTVEPLGSLVAEHVGTREIEDCLSNQIRPAFRPILELLPHQHNLLRYIKRDDGYGKRRLQESMSRFRIDEVVKFSNGSRVARNAERPSHRDESSGLPESRWILFPGQSEIGERADSNDCQPPCVCAAAPDNDVSGVLSDLGGRQRGEPSDAPQAILSVDLGSREEATAEGLARSLSDRRHLRQP